MHPAIKAKSFDDALKYVKETFLACFPGAPVTSIQNVFHDIRDIFAGRLPGYQAIDLEFHDLEHTLRGTTAMTALMKGVIDHYPRKDLIKADLFELGIISVLFHDTGYLKPEGDNRGTGAKFTREHVERSCEFAGAYLQRLGYTRLVATSAANMILCTGLGVETSNIPFKHLSERIVGFCLGAGDLLGQMADPRYPEKLRPLYEEFAEAQAVDPQGLPQFRFSSFEDLYRKTPGFYHGYVLKTLKTQYGAVHEYLSNPYPNGRNAFLEAIEANIRRIEADLRENRLPG